MSVRALLQGNEAHFSNKLTFAVPIKKYELQGSAVKMKVENLGINTISSVEVTYKYGNNAPVSQTVNLTLLSKQTTSFVIPNLTLDANETIEFSVTKLNGAAFASDKKSCSVLTYTAGNTATRKVLLEQFTTENCGWCPYGTSKIKNATEQTEFKNKIVWVSHHAGYGTDPYTIPVSEQFTRFYGTSGTYAPAFMLNRSILYESEKVPLMQVGDETSIAQQLRDALAEPALITVNIAQNNNDNNVNITVSGEYKGVVPAEPLYVNVFILQDGLVSSSQGDYSGSFPAPYTHNHVMRAALNGADGTAVTWNGNSYSVNVNGTLNPAWVKDNLKVTAFVSKSWKKSLNDVFALNAEQVKYQINTGIDHAYANSLGVFAKNGKVFANGEYITMKVYDVNGKEIHNENLEKGVYMVRLTDGNRTATKKVVVQ